MMPSARNEHKAPAPTTVCPTKYKKGGGIMAAQEEITALSKLRYSLETA